MKKREWMKRDVLIVEVAAWIICLAALALTVVSVKAATGPVPVHFGFDGQPDRWGSPIELVALPVIILITVASMSLVLHLVDPRYWNRPGTLREGEEPAWYLASARMLVWMELECALFCIVLQQGISSGEAGAAVASSVGLVVAMLVTMAVLLRSFYWKRPKG